MNNLNEYNINKLLDLILDIKNNQKYKNITELLQSFTDVFN